MSLEKACLLELSGVGEGSDGDLETKNENYGMK